MKTRLIHWLLFFIFLILLSVIAIKLYINQNNLSKNGCVFYGNVERHDVILSFRVGGRITAMYPQEGEKVKQNALLASLATDTFTAEKNIAEANLNKAIAILKNAQLTFQRRATLETRAVISRALYDKALAKRDESQAAVALSVAELEKAKIALSDTALIAPIDGTILTRVREPGAIINATDPVYTLSIDNPVWIRAYVDETSLGHIKPFEEVLVYSDTFPKKPYKGRISFISTTAEFTPKNVETTTLRTALVYRFRVIIDNDNENTLRQGMPVTIYASSSSCQKNH